MTLGGLAQTKRLTPQLSPLSKLSFLLFSSLLPFQGLALDAIAPGQQPKATALPSKSGLVSIQIGPFTSLGKARQAQSILKTIGDILFKNNTVVEIDRMRSRENSGFYRVLVGRFVSFAESNQFIKNYQLREAFKDSWVSSIDGEELETRLAEPLPVLGQLDQDPYTLNINLLCEGGRKYGVYKANFHPDTARPIQELDLTLNWNCISNPPERWLAQDEQKSPSHLTLGPLTGAGSLSMNDSALSAMNRTDFSYGLQMTAFKSFGGMGPTLDYRLLNHRYNGDAGTISPSFFLAHRFSVGARLPLFHRLEIQPLLGVFTQGLLQGSTPENATLLGALLWQTGMKATVHAFELNPRAWLDFIAAVQYILPSTTKEFTLYSGSEITAKMQTQGIFQNNWGVQWSLEMTLRTLSASSFTQTDLLFLAGASVLLSYE